MTDQEIIDTLSNKAKRLVEGGNPDHFELAARYGACMRILRGETPFSTVRIVLLRKPPPEPEKP